MVKVTPLGDLHNGKQTELVQTENETYIKKPRDFKTEVAFSLFCKKLESLGLPCFSRSAVLIEEGDGFHTEAVEKTYESLLVAEKENRLRFIHPADTADINVSLMQGLSGVAYALAMYGDPLSGGMLL